MRPFQTYAFVPVLLLSVLPSIVFATKTDAAERNVLFIITDDESPTLGCYGDPVAVTPAIDSVARDGLIFRNAMATTASCSASRSSRSFGQSSEKFWKRVIEPT